LTENLEQLRRQENHDLEINPMMRLIADRHPESSLLRGLRAPLRDLAIFMLLGSQLFLAHCGYQVAGKGDRLPPDVKTIAIPMFVNQTPRFRIEQTLTAAVTREFLERTKFQITHETDGADAVLRGTVKDVRAGAVSFDPHTGRATTFQIQVTADVQLQDLHTHKVIFSNHNYLFRDEYQVSPSTSQIFEEDQPALERISQDLARTLVTDILENF
jgi:outer membrane lipopolysaccharide assembly protein LptE/RlpB